MDDDGFESVYVKFEIGAVVLVWFRSICGIFVVVSGLTDAHVIIRILCDN